MRISDWSSDVCSSDLWGDPLFADSPEFDPLKQSAAAQVRQFGYNNDFIGYVGLPFGSDNPDHGLICVNPEYTSPEVMFPGAEDASNDRKSVVSGTGGSVRVVLGGRRVFHKKKRYEQLRQH